jgi:hypothetical protein
LELERRMNEKHNPIVEKPQIIDRSPVRMDPDDRPLKPAKIINLMNSPVDVTFNPKKELIPERSSPPK